MNKYTIRIFDGVYTTIYTTEANTMSEAENKIIALCNYKKVTIIKMETKEIK